MASDLIIKTKDFVFELFKNELEPTFLYHNFKHTERVYKSTKEIIENSEVSEVDKQILELTAWLHDTGYTKGAENHEERSVEIATEFLNGQNVDSKIIEEVNKCIMATKFNDQPKT
ncbi:MAG: HD domain-containing protein, partial [Bacteroidota bacterium]